MFFIILTLLSAVSSSDTDPEVTIIEKFALNQTDPMGGSIEMIYWYEEDRFNKEQLLHCEFYLQLNDNVTWLETDTLRITFEYGYTENEENFDEGWKTIRHKLRFNKDGDDGEWYGAQSEL